MSENYTTYQTIIMRLNFPNTSSLIHGIHKLLHHVVQSFLLRPPPYTVPTGPPRNIRVVYVDTSSVQLTWDTPHPTHVNDRNGVTSYQVRLNNAADITAKNRSISYTSLRPNTTYSVEIAAVNTIGISERIHAGRLNFTTSPVGTCWLCI